jgi:Tol biopolymer transport system component
MNRIQHLLAALLLCAAVAAAADHGVVVQAWLPEESAQLDWGDGYTGPRNELWNDCFLAYEMFCSRPGIDSAHDRIHMLWGRGFDYRRPRDDRYAPEIRFLWKVKSITDDSACITTVENTFASLAGQMGPSDTLFCYTWGHGDHDYKEKMCGSLASHFSIQVRPILNDTGADLWDTAFGRMANAVNAQRVFIMQQCYGGGFIDDLSDGSTYVICATTAGRGAHSADNISKRGSPIPEHEVVQQDTFRHVEFSFHFLNALRGKVPWPPGSSDSLHPARADYNHDGKVSWEEAFMYADSFDSQEDRPVMHRPDSFWRVRASIPGSKSVRQGGALAPTHEVSGTETLTIIYALKGGNSCEFWAYYPDGDSWVEKESIPRNGSGGSRPVGKGGTLVAARNGRLYATKGKCFEFWEYNPISHRWIELASVPPGPNNRTLKNGTCCVAVTLGESTYVYLLKGNRTQEMYRYCAESRVWQTLDTAPLGPNGKTFKNGSCMAWDGGDTLFVLKGTYNEFWAYSLSGRNWQQRAYLPSWTSRTVKAKDGSAMAVCGGKVYVLKGGSKPPEVWIYSRNFNGWSPMPYMPTGPSGKTRCGAGASMVSAEGFLWLFRGKNTSDFYRLTPRRYTLFTPSTAYPLPPGPSEVPIALGLDAEQPRWSPSGEKVVFSRPDSSGNLQLWLAQIGGGERRVTSLNGDCECPAWSPDGSRIAFQFTPTGSPYSQIGVVDTAGMVLFVTTDSYDKEYPDWSPDGASIAYQADDSSGFTQIYTIGANGGAGCRRTCEPVDHELPRFCSSTSIIYQREGPNGFSQIYRLDLGSSQENQLTFSDADHEHPAVAVTAGLVVFEVSPADGFTQIGTVPVGGGTEKLLTGGNYDFTDPSISANGADIYCVRWSGDGSAICRVNPNGGYELLTDDAVDRKNPHTSSAGLMRSAVYVRPDGVYRIAQQSGGGSQSAGGFDLELEQALPSPAPERVRISYSLPELSEVSLKIYNSAGQLVRTLVRGRVKPGHYTAVWDREDERGRRVNAGVYFYQLEVGAKILSRKVVLAE